MKDQSRHPSHETIVKIFRDLGLDDPELCRRLQDFSKPEIWPRQIARCDDVIITRSNTAPDEGAMIIENHREIAFIKMAQPVLISGKPTGSPELTKAPAEQPDN